MKNIFLAPRAQETSHDNFESTILKGRDYSFVESFLTTNEKEILSKYNTLYIWGAKESLKARWDKMQIGDYVLFYKQGIFYYSSEVIMTKYSEELGGKLWPSDEDGKVWPCLFFVTNIKEIEIPIKVLQELAEYQPTWDRVQAFMRLRDDGLTAIINKFGSIETFIHQPKQFFNTIDKVLESIQDEVVEGEVEEINDITNLISEVNAYKDSGPSHTFEMGILKKRQENKAQKRKIAQIEGYACQICNWSLKWINSIGTASYRIDVDHIIEKSKGGGEEVNNLWVLCPNCHIKKTLGVITIDPITYTVIQDGVEIKLHHNKHLNK